MQRDINSSFLSILPSRNRLQSGKYQDAVRDFRYALVDDPGIQTESELDYNRLRSFANEPRYSRMSDVTRILSQIESGDPSAAEKLLPLVYDELRKLAAAKLAKERPGQTLQATALVHEAYLRLVGNDVRGESW